MKKTLVNNLISLRKNSGGQPGKSSSWQPAPGCQKCADRGVVIVGQTAYPCPCTQQKNLQRQFQYANITKELSQYNFNDFSFDYYSKTLIDPINKRSTYFQLAKMAFDASRKFVADLISGTENTGLLFTGPVGSGKTFLAACIANSLVQQQRQVLFAVVPDLLDEIKETFNKNGEYTELQLLKKLREVPILILDDLGVHNYTAWTQNKIYSILNYRLNHKLPTVITTNLSLEQIDELLGERTTSRIIQMCKVYPMLVEKDIRHLKHLVANKS